MHFLLIPLAGLLSMDRLTAFNFMISRPLVVSVLIGTAGGNVFWCLVGGIFFELLGLLDLPVGTRIANDDTFGAFAYAILAVWAPISTTGRALEAVVICFCIMFPITFTTRLLRYANKRLLLCLKNRGEKNFEGRLILVGQILAFLRGTVFYPMGAFVCAAIYMALSYATPKEIPYFAVVLPLALMGGYFIRFFHSPIFLKILLFLGGGLLSWLFF